MSLRPSAQKVGTVTALVCMASRKRFVLVESGTELDLLRPHVRGRAQIEDMSGRPNVQEAWRILDSRGRRNFLAMVDADFDEVVGRNRAATRLVYVSVADNRRDSTIDLEAAAALFDFPNSYERPPARRQQRSARSALQLWTCLRTADRFKGSAS
jgi:hypothetical protein